MRGWRLIVLLLLLLLIVLLLLLLLIVLLEGWEGKQTASSPLKQSPTIRCH